MQPREMGKQLLHLPVEGTHPQPITLEHCSLHPALSISQLSQSLKSYYRTFSQQHPYLPMLVDIKISLNRCFCLCSIMIRRFVLPGPWPDLEEWLSFFCTIPIFFYPNKIERKNNPQCVKYLDINKWKKKIYSFVEMGKGSLTSAVFSLTPARVTALFLQLSIFFSQELIMKSCLSKE